MRSLGADVPADPARSLTVGTASMASAPVRHGDGWVEGDGDGDGERSLERLLAELRRRGQRVTTGRRAVAEAVVSAHYCTAEEIVERVQQAHSEVHPSTVYRTLETLEEAGLIEHLHFGHGPARWLLANDPSHHLVCEACGRVQQVPRQLFDRVRDQLEAEYGFAIDLHHFANVGRCASCR
ncbi:MAG: Fur family transcriptional regulator [Acidimicrobiales bacterium]